MKTKTNEACRRASEIAAATRSRSGMRSSFVSSSAITAAFAPARVWKMSGESRLFSLEPRPNGGERIRAPLNFEADCPAQHDVAAQVLANGRFSGANILRDRFEIFSQLFRIRPRNRAPLSSQRVHGEVCAVRAEAGLGPSVIAVVQLAAAEQVRQLKLLRDRRAES